MNDNSEREKYRASIAKVQLNVRTNGLAIAEIMIAVQTAAETYQHFLDQPDLPPAQRHAAQGSLDVLAPILEQMQISLGVVSMVAEAHADERERAVAEAATILPEGMTLQ